MKIHHEALHMKTKERLHFIDLTDQISEMVQQCGIRHGLVNVQTRHTTTAILINEHEPLLLGDMQQLLENIAPQAQTYQHDNFHIRTVNMCPDERPNGHAHCRAMLMSSSETVNILEGTLQLGRWQRIFLVELDGEREREVSVMIMGV
jgi:secondary thiamine-phosphate synthase enzyme